MLKKGFWLAYLIAFTACEKTVHLVPDHQSQLLVVDGTIESGMPPQVILTRSFSYFDTITAAQLQQSYVHNARVSISDGNQNYPLTEYNYTLMGQVFWYYAPAQTSYFNGRAGRQYTLHIEVDSQQYTAVTTVPPLAKTLDSLWWKPAPNAKDSESVVLWGRFTDPAGFGNYVRYYTRTNSESFYAGLPSVFDDELTDGTTYNLQIDRGYNRGLQLNIISDNYGVFMHGDTVTVKLSNINKATYDFWRTWDYDYQTNGNPFSSPIKVLGNVSNNALGAFCGYTSQYQTLIIPK
ncbi:DUF4249 domain-containing protein [Deminuibacter soli]|uniref:DUF4249 domain-containing protein n=1 Tax=Deminuibacter soli TaxID=2291815 RepID=A0A3E1NGV6_9BACT|nr:DUF4249 domain-containing protein [Deminuibacter soli]RFM27117.1 DUF4249 domain-containing protein [Deminuibacter soli]